MKRKILSLLLVMTMLMSYTPFTFAEGLDTEGSVESQNENIEEISNITADEEVDTTVEELNTDKEQISSDSIYEVQEDTEIIEVVEKEQEDIDSPADSIYEVGNDTEIIEGDTGVTEGSDEPSEPIEEVTPTPDLDSSEEATEGSEDNLDIDESFGVDSEDTSDTAEEEIDSEFGVDAEDTNVEESNKGEEITTGDTYIDPSQDDSGYVVIETPEGAYDDLDINGPTATEENPEEKIDEEYTISEREEQQGQVEPRDPLIFKSYDGLTLYRAEDGTIAASDYTCTNSTGVDVAFIGVEVVPINGWSMVGSEVDFKNMKAGTREFRLTVNNQVVQDFDGDGFIAMYNPVVFLNGEEICIPMGLEIGPFKDGLCEGLFSFVIVFEEIIKEEPVKEEVKDDTKEEIIENKEETQEETQEEKQEDTSSEDTTEGKVEETQEPSSDNVEVDTENTTEEIPVEEGTPTGAESSADMETEVNTDSPANTDASTDSEEVKSDEQPEGEETLNSEFENTEDLKETEASEDEPVVPDTEIEVKTEQEESISSKELIEESIKLDKVNVILDKAQFVQAKAKLIEMEKQIELCPIEKVVAPIKELKIDNTCAAPIEEVGIVENISVVEEITEEPVAEVEIETITVEVESETVENDIED